MEQLGEEGVVDGLLDVDAGLEQLLKVVGRNGGALLRQTGVEQARGLVEDVAEETVVLVVEGVGRLVVEVLDVAVVELQGAALVAVDGGRGEQGPGVL